MKKYKQQLLHCQNLNSQGEYAECLKQGIGLVEQAERLYGKDSVSLESALFILGSACVCLEQLEQGRELLERAVKLSPRDSINHHLIVCVLGTVYNNSRLFKEAYTLLIKYADSKDDILHVELGRTCLVTHHWKQAYVSTKYAYDANPADPYRTRLLGTVYIVMKQWVLAVRLGMKLTPQFKLHDSGLRMCNWCLVIKHKDLMFGCSRCLNQHYCGKECQRKSWKRNHRYECVLNKSW